MTINKYKKYGTVKLGDAGFVPKARSLSLTSVIQNPAV